MYAQIYPLQTLCLQGVLNYPAWIRTRTKRTKISCATVTLPGKKPAFVVYLYVFKPLATTKLWARLGTIRQF